MPHPTHTAVVRHPEHGMYEALDPARDYDENDPIVLAYPWAFVPIENAGEIVESVKIERATAEPGKKRRISRAKKAPAKKTATPPSA